MLSSTACPDYSGKSRLEGKPFFFKLFLFITALFMSSANIFSQPLPTGTYTVGTGGYFATIQAAFNKLETDGVAGNVTLELIDELYTAPADTFGFLLDGPIPGVGPNTRVTIKPAENKNVTIEGGGIHVLYLLNTNYLTFDGISITGPTTLTIRVLYNTQFTYNNGLAFANNSDYNIVQNIIFINESSIRIGVALAFECQLSGQTTPDNNLIQSNFIKQSGIGIWIGTDEFNLRPTGNIIKSNIVGSETDSLISWGIQVERNQNAIIEDNVIQSIRGASTAFAIAHGINCYGCTESIIRNNIVHNVKTSYTGGSMGIALIGDGSNVGNGNLVYNNMVYDINSSSSASWSNIGGIHLEYQNNAKVYYNSVYLSGTGANHLGSAALYLLTNVTNTEAKNNILVNTRDESPYCASAIYDYSSANLISDYNDLFYQTNQYNCLVRISSTNYHTLADWQAQGKDLHSLNESVNFVSPSDLHINTNYNTLLDGNATPISGITLDFDGETRNTSTPDIGADEFEPNPNATNWQMQNSNFPSDVMTINFSAVDNQTCWAIGQKIPPNTTPYSGFIKTTNGGTSWSLSTIPGITNGYLDEIFAFDENTAYITCYKLVGTTGTIGIYKTTDGGATWNRQDAYNSSPTGPAYIYFFDEQNGLVIGDYLETYTTTNGGEDWDAVTMPTPLTDEWTYLGENRFSVVGNTIWFCTNKGRVFKSTDKGYTWTIIFSESQYYDWMPSIAFQNEEVGIYALKEAGNETDHIYRKTVDGGITWNIISNSVLDNLAPSGLQYIPGSISTYVVTGGRASTMRGFAVSYDAGESWTLLDTLGNVYVSFPSDVKGWGSQFGSNMLHSYVGPRITNVEEEVIDLMPTEFLLSQNYPNPFNPSTTFRYSIPTQSKVVIKVFDVLGNEIATLMDEEKSVGTYELTWNAVNLTSGVYFYQVKAGEFVNTKKMILLK